MYKYISRVTICAVWVDTYDDQNLSHLYGPHHDVEMLKWLLVDNEPTALYNPDQFIEIPNPQSSELRDKLNNYIIDRSADGDILLFYFSGHGVAIGRDDFGFCTADTIIHPLARVALPLSVVKISEILSTINIANVIPIFIIDACYSGLGGKQVKPPLTVIDGLHNQVQNSEASSYALFCACSENQTAIDRPSGGLFSQALVDVASQGLQNKEATLTFTSVYQKLNDRVLQIAFDSTPRLYLGQTMPEIPFVINTKFVFRRFHLSPTYINIIKALWNDGQDRELEPHEIGVICGNSAFCNHNKLSFAPWQLVETVPNTRRRRLTDRGIHFVLGDLSVPKVVKQDPRTGDVVAVDGSSVVSISDYM